MAAAAAGATSLPLSDGLGDPLLPAVGLSGAVTLNTVT